MDILEQAAIKSRTVSSRALGDVAYLVQRQSDLENIIKKSEEELDRLKESHKKISEQQLPDLMDEIGLTEIKLEDGTTIKVQSFYNATIPQEMAEEAFAWLDKNGFGALVKTQLVMQFTREEREEALATAKKLQEEGYEVKPVENIHSSTLRAFIRERYEERAPNEPLPPSDLFGTFVGKRTKISKK